MAQDRIGLYRDSMNDNPLLAKSQLGRPLKRGFSLPPDDFTYGRPNTGKDGGTAEAMGNWNAALPSMTSKPGEQKRDRDFIGLNRAAIKAGLVTSGEHYHFRANHDIRRKMSPSENKIRTRRIPPDMTFGISTRPSTPVFDLLEHKYQDRWLQQRRLTELTNREKQQRKILNGNIYETRASLLRKYSPVVEAPPLWHMPRFERVHPHLETFRSPEARKLAFRAHSHDATSRTGVFGHGIYAAAKS
ncbi:CFAP77 [Branchiostoma lanceolatum]|uniref:CFAP77 protein n=1 Tax=Branchiostoma lanceolatum TaxID=7740 RepID=A0A8K0AAA0_BRALA|nr:CFAP77 [Branchiostoma lanceolatum]